MSSAKEDHLTTQMIIPVSKKTYFNTDYTLKTARLCAYDMLYHPPDYNPKSARSDRQEPKIIRKNIWNQELHKGIPSTTYLQLGRPKWKAYDLPTKEFVRVHGNTVAIYPFKLKHSNAYTLLFGDSIIGITLVLSQTKSTKEGL